jgi:hypothetical protein
LKIWYHYSGHEKGDLSKSIAETLFTYPDSDPLNRKSISALEAYFAALDRYEGGRDAKSSHTSDQSRLVAKYMSYIHDIFSNRRERLNSLKTSEEKAIKEKAFKQTIKTFITEIIDANTNCVDQMVSRLNIQILNIIINEVPSSDKNKEDIRKKKLTFKVGLALCQLRESLISEHAVKLYPHEAHMADLERYAKGQLADRMNLAGSIFKSGAFYQSIMDRDEKTNKIGEAALADYDLNYLIWLTEECQASKNSVPVTSSLRDDIFTWANNHLHTNSLKDNDAFIEKISAFLNDELVPNAKDGGPLTFEATLAYLETIGILIRK